MIDIDDWDSKCLPTEDEGSRGAKGYNYEDTVCLEFTPTRFLPYWVVAIYYRSTKASRWSYLGRVLSDSFDGVVDKIKRKDLGNIGPITVTFNKEKVVFESEKEITRWELL